jgi:hypothetical protein
MFYRNSCRCPVCGEVVEGTIQQLCGVGVRVAFRGDHITPERAKVIEKTRVCLKCRRRDFHTDVEAVLGGVATTR